MDLFLNGQKESPVISGHYLFLWLLRYVHTFNDSDNNCKVRKIKQKTKMKIIVQIHILKHEN